MEFQPYFVFCGYLAGIYLFSVGLNMIYSWYFPSTAFRLLRAPGVAVHELSHALACILTGARIHSFRIFILDPSSETLGYVEHSQPRIPVLGNILIAAAPFIGIPAGITVLMMIFEAFGSVWFPEYQSFSLSLAGLYLVLETALRILWMNLIAGFHPWFLLFSYLNISLILSLSPSDVDLRHPVVHSGPFSINLLAAVVILFIGGAGILYLDWGILNRIALGIFEKCSVAIYRSVSYEVLAFLCLLPFVLLRRHA